MHSLTERFGLVSRCFRNYLCLAKDEKERGGEFLEEALFFLIGFQESGFRFVFLVCGDSVVAEFG